MAIAAALALGCGFAVAAAGPAGAAPGAPGAPGGITPVAPLAPTIGRALAGESSSTVIWTVADDGGSAITSFTVTPYLRHKTALRSFVIEAGASGSATDSAVGAVDHAVVSGLTDGDPYSFAVAATNAVETGPASVMSRLVVPSAMPQSATFVRTSPPMAYGQCVTATATVIVGGGAPATGTVTFGGLGAPQVVPVVPSPSGHDDATSAPVCDLSARTHRVRGTYLASGQATSSGVGFQVVRPDNTEAAVVVPGALPGSGNMVSLGDVVQISVTTADSSATPVGKVSVGGTADPEPLVLHLVDGGATVPTKWIPAGPGGTTYQLTATYAGSRNFAAATAATATAVIVQPATTTLLLSDSLHAASTVFTAALNPNLVNGVRAHGAVTFLGRPLGTTSWTVLGSAPLSNGGTAKLTVNNARLGSDAVFQATFGGDAPFLDAAFADLLGRAPTPAEESTYLDQLGSGSTPTDVATELVSSVEYRTDSVVGWYERFLQRSPTANELTYWLAAIGGGTTDEQVIATILGSSEFYFASGGSDQTFITAASIDLLGTTPTPSDLTFYETQIAQGATRTDVATELDTSFAYDDQLVTGWYQQFLARSPTSNELTYWTALIGGGTTDEEVIAQLVGSTEYRTLHSTDNFAAATSNPVLAPSVDVYIQSLYSQLLGRSAQSNELSFGEAQLAAGTAPTDVATELVSSVEYRTDSVVGWYERFLQRSPTANELTYWLAAIGGGTTDEQVIATILGSSEFYFASGGSDQTFITAASIDLLGTTPTPSDLTFYETQIAQGATRTDVATELDTSFAYDDQLVTGWYQQFLARSPTSNELTYWTALIGGGTTDEEVIAQLVGSTEYRTLHS